MDTPKSIDTLFKKYLANDCTGQEIDQLIRLFENTDESTLRQLISAALSDDNGLAENLPQYDERLALIYNKISNEIQQARPGNLRNLPGRSGLLWLRVAAAAVILVFLSVGGYFLIHKEKPNVQIAKTQIKDIAPGGNKAVLILANGKKIALTDAKNGALARQGAVYIDKTADGQVVYSVSENPALPNGGAAQLNTVETPRGGKYEVTLPDGSKAWLDAASSIRFPVAFTGNSRLVSVTGQVYFEVAHDASRPFRVTAKGQTVEVLGTHFNINAYDDEQEIKTTLLEGSVRVLANGLTAVLKPGQQSVLDDNKNKISVNNVDVDEAVAWKNGYFIFENENIHSIMRKLSRWYDIEPDYAPNISEIGFGGIVSRNKNISEVLRVLELTRAVHFKIEGRRIKVMP